MTDENNKIKFFLYENWARTKTGQHTVLDNNHFAPATQILESRRSELKELKGGSEGRECIAS